MKLINISPNDQTLVGLKIARTNWGPGEYIKPKYIGDYFLIGLRENGLEEVRSISLDWVEYEEPKKKKILSPCISKALGQTFLSTALFESEMKAKEAHPLSFHSWPARDRDGAPIQYLIEE